MGILQQCHCWKKSLSPCHFNSPLQSGGSVSTDADGGVVLLHFPCLPGGVTPDPQGQEKALVSFSFQQEKCHFDVGGGKVGGSPWLVRKHCFYVISFHTPAMCGK